MTAAANTDATMTCKPPHGDPNPWVSIMSKADNSLDQAAGHATGAAHSVPLVDDMLQAALGIFFLPGP